VAPLVKPFRALRFDTDAAGSLDTLVAPPYDVISLEGMRGLVSRSPHNVIRLIRPRQPELAAARLREWTAQHILVREDRPAVWQIEEEYVGPDGVARIRHGLVARVKLESYDAGVVLPHERVFSAPAESRLRLIRATRTKLSPVLLLHDGPALPAKEQPPDLQATLEGATSRLWRIDDPAAIDAARATVRPPFVIADGHHRYDAALRFHDEERRDETAYVLAALVSRDDPGLTIFPTHRLLAGAVPALNGDFRLSPVAGGARQALESLAGLGRDRPAFALVRPGETVLAQQLVVGEGALARLDVSALDRLALGDVTFTPFVEEVEDAVRSGRASAAFLVRAPTVADVQEVAQAGETMPEKSTYFFPKLVSGLLLSPFDE
jgi:uncharacterized protein (DUF1015 family)